MLRIATVLGWVAFFGAALLAVSTLNQAQRYRAIVPLVNAVCDHFGSSGPSAVRTLCAPAQDGDVSPPE